MSDEVVLERLRRGAEIMGELWREGQRCTAQWSSTGKCECKKRSKFCAARSQWVDLMLAKDAENQDRQLDTNDADHPFGLFDHMLASELAATGLTITLDNGVKVGPSGNVGYRLAIEIATDEAPGAGALAMLLKSFRGSKVTQVERPVEKR